MTMTDAELVEIRAPMTREDVQYIHNSKAMHYSNMPVEIRQLCADYIALLDELAAARKENERLRQCVEHVELWAHDCHAGEDPNALYRTAIYGFEDIEGMCRAALHSATEDADDRTT